jgi:hypothetical protein
MTPQVCRSKSLERLYVGIKMCSSSIIHKPCDLSVRLPVMEVFVPVSHVSKREAVIICGL